jgi:hypothetical protein
MNRIMMPGREWIPYPSIPNLQVLGTKVWENKLCKESDRFVLPMLYTPGYVNAGIGDDPPTPPDTSKLYDDDITGFTHYPNYREPRNYWGKSGFLMTRPRAVIFDEPERYGKFVTHNADLLDTNNIFTSCIFNPGFDLVGAYFGFLLTWLPWESTSTITVSFPVGGGGTGTATVIIPTTDPTKYVGGNTLFLTSARQNYSPSNNDLLISALLDSDVLQFKAAIKSFEKVQVRIIDFFQDSSLTGFLTSAEGACTGAGIDCIYDGFALDMSPQMDADIANIKTFFGIR